MATMQPAHGETKLVFAPDHPAFAGHFPGAPIVPGVLLLDAAVHALLSSLRLSMPSSGAAVACQISAVKFLSPVGPGESLNMKYETLVSGSTRFDIFSGDRKVVAGTLVLAHTP